jgi:VanZ family protein
MRNRILAFVFLILGATTIGIGLFADHYEVVGGNLLTEIVARDGQGGWQAITGKGCESQVDVGNISIECAPGSKWGQVRQFVPDFPAEAMVRLKAAMRVQEVVPGEKGYHRARILLVQNDGKKDRWDFDHTLVLLDGTQSWQRYLKVFHLRPETQTLSVRAQMSHCSGALEARDIVLEPVRLAGWYPPIRNAMIGLWGLFFIALLLTGINGRQGRTVKAMLLVLGVVIVIGVTLPPDLRQEMTANTTQTIEKGARKLNGMADRSDNQFLMSMEDNISKVGHFVLFLLLGFFMAFARGPRPMRDAIFVLLVFAASTEMIQFFIDGREPGWVDFGVDCVGGGGGVAVAIMVQRLKQLMGNNRTEC